MTDEQTPEAPRRHRLRPVRRGISGPRRHDRHLVSLATRSRADSLGGPLHAGRGSCWSSWWWRAGWPTDASRPASRSGCAANWLASPGISGR